MERLPTSEEALGQGFQSAKLPNTNIDGPIPADLVAFFKETGAALVDHGFNLRFRKIFQTDILTRLAEEQEGTKRKHLPDVLEATLSDIDGYDPYIRFSYLRSRRRPFRDRVLAAKTRAGILKSSPGFYRDVYESTNLAIEIANEGRIDTLTGLPNRRGLEDELRLREAFAKRGKLDPKRMSIVSADVDNLKLRNDSLGHAAGDELLLAATKLLQESCRVDMDIIARTGGDEFTLVLTECDTQGAKLWLRRFKKLMAQTFLHDNSNVGISVGIANLSLDDLQGSFRKADTRLYADKRKRKAIRPTTNTLVAPTIRV